MMAAWLIPNHYAPWTSFYNDSAMAIALAFLAALAFRRPSAIGAPWVAWGVLAMATIPWLQWAFGQLYYTGDAWISSLYLLGLAIAIITGRAGASLSIQDFSAFLASTLAAAALASSVLALAQIFPGLELGIWSEDAVSGMRAHANLAQPNNLGTLIGFGASSVMLLFEQRRISGLVASLLAVVLLVGGALTQSRTALLYGPLICVGVLVLTWRRQVTFRTHWTALAGASALQWLATWALPKLQGAALLTATWSAGSRGVESFRFQMWTVLMDALVESPWKGYGWLQGGAAELAAVDRRPPVGELWLHSHNLFLDLLVWCGYPLGLLLSVLIIWWFASRFISVCTVESAIGILLIAVLGLHAMLELPHHYAYFLIPAGLWAGVVEWETAAPVRGGARSFGALCSVGLVILIGVWRDYPTIEEEFRTVRFEYLHIGPAASDRYSPSAPFLSTLTAFLRVSRTPYDVVLSEGDLQAFEQAVNRYPYPSLMARYAAALSVNRQDEKARAVFQKILQVYGGRTYSAQRKELIEYSSGRSSQLRGFAESLPP